ncbi:hypothetical protein [Hyalangium gracile]|uniref:hypothetical protein n=1 Tax=Hyalangium gracile TaxID=394092 RepID=UPI001CD02F9B|nr:hypothetical protein [Hyalangium gracile]
MPSPSPQNRQGSDRNGGDSQPESGKNLPNKLVIVTDDVVAAPEPVSSLQRFRVHVPKPDTQLLLGERAKGTPAGVPTFGYTGASLQTVGNLFIDVKEDIVIQNQGFTLMQTQDLWQQYSTSLMELSSPAAVKVVGGQVFLGATDSVQAPSLRVNNGADLSPNTGNDLTPAMAHLAAVGSGWDIGLSVLSLVATAVFFSPLDVKDTNSWIKTAETAWSTGKKLYDLKKKFDPPTPKKDVNIYGKEGVNIMTPKKVSLTAEDSVKVFASWGVTISSAASSTMMAVQGVKCFGGLKASLEGGTYADVKAGVALGVSCLRGKLKLKALEIEIGSHDPKWTQLATTKIKVKALQEIAFDSKQTFKVNTGKSTKVEAKENFEVKADKAVRIQVGSYCIEVKTDGIKIGKGDNGTPSDPIITVKGRNIILKSSGMHAKVQDSSVQLGNRSTYVNIVDSGNVMVKGNLIKLG